MPKIELDTTQVFIYGAIWSVFCGVVGWFANFGVSAYRLRIARQHSVTDARQGRQREFLAFLKGWAADVSANRRMVSENNVMQTVAERFDKKRVEFVSEVAQIESDFDRNRSSKFSALSDKIVAMTPGQIDSENGRQQLLKAINDLVSFVKSE